jgi:hypothetical protein
MGGWHEVEEKVACEKACQCLRDIVAANTQGNVTTGRPKVVAVPGGIRNMIQKCFVKQAICLPRGTGRSESTVEQSSNGRPSDVCSPDPTALSAEAKTTNDSERKKHRLSCSSIEMFSPEGADVRLVNLIGRKRRATWRELESNETASESVPTLCDNASSACGEPPRHEEPIPPVPTKRFQAVDRDVIVDLADDDSMAGDEDHIAEPDPGDATTLGAAPLLNRQYGCSDKASKDTNCSSRDDIVNLETDCSGENSEVPIAESGSAVDNPFDVNVVAAARSLNRQVDTNELYKTFVGMVHLARTSPRAADYLNVCLSKCSRAMDTIVAWESKHGDNSEALDVDTVEFEC